MLSSNHRGSHRLNLRRILILAALAGGAGRLLSGQQLVMDDVSVKIPAEALSLLTTVTPIPPDKLILLTFEWQNGRLDSPSQNGCWEPASLKLSLVLGPSVGNSSRVMNIIGRAHGNLWVGSDHWRWRIEQYNFGTYFARAGFEPLRRRLSFFLPVAFLSDVLTHDYEGALHAVLGFSCQVNSQRTATCAGPHFVFDFRWEYFPESPPLIRLLSPPHQGAY
jgi:hypothetical protein